MSEEPFSILTASRKAEPPAPDFEARFNRIENALLKLAEQPKAPQMESGAASMLAVLDWSQRNRQSAINELGTTLSVIQQIQTGQVNLKPESGAEWIKPLAEVLIPVLLPLLTRTPAPPVQTAPAIEPPKVEPAPEPIKDGKLGEPPK